MRTLCFSSTRRDGICRIGCGPAEHDIVPLPPKCPELNPVENIWQYMRDNWLSNRVFQSYTNIVDHCCDAWNKLIAQPWTIMSVGLRALGLWVLINESWYKGSARRPPRRQLDRRGTRGLAFLLFAHEITGTVTQTQPNGRETCRPG